MFIASWNTHESSVTQYLGEDNFITADLPFDYLDYHSKGSTAIERKAVPEDLLSSVQDGRLNREFAAMREHTFRILLLQGSITYSNDGHVILGRKPSRWTCTSVRNLLRSVRYVEGIDIEYSVDAQDSAAVLTELHNYFQNEHAGFRTRQRFESAWPKTTQEERLVYWLQGIPTGANRFVGPQLATIIRQRLVSVPQVCAATMQEWRDIKGVGKKTAEAIYQFLHGEV